MHIWYWSLYLALAHCSYINPTCSQFPVLRPRSSYLIQLPLLFWTPLSFSTWRISLSVLMETAAGRASTRTAVTLWINLGRVGVSLLSFPWLWYTREKHVKDTETEFTFTLPLGPKGCPLKCVWPSRTLRAELPMLRPLFKTEEWCLCPSCQLLQPLFLHLGVQVHRHSHLKTEAGGS